MRLALVCALCWAVSAYTLEGRGPAGARLVLNGGERTAEVRGDGSFAIENMVSGVHLLEVYHPAALYPSFKVNIGSEAGDAQAVRYDHPGAQKASAALPLDIKPVAPAVYVEPRAGFDMWALARSPMFLMMVLPIALMACMKFCVSPDQIAEIQAQQAQMGPAGGDPASMLRQIFSGEEPARPAAAAPAARK